MLNANRLILTVVFGLAMLAPTGATAQVPLAAAPQIPQVGLPDVPSALPGRSLQSGNGPQASFAAYRPADLPLRYFAMLMQDTPRYDMGLLHDTEEAKGRGMNEAGTWRQCTPCTAS